MELLKSLRSEKSPLSRDEVSKILALGTKTGTEPELALDLRDSSIFWVNDLEKDEEYEDWPDDLTQLFFRMGGIMLRPVRRNVFNLVLTLDPSDVGGTAGLLRLLQSFMQHKSPVRIGLVFHHQGENKNAELVRRLMNYAGTEGKSKQAFNDIVQVRGQRLQ
jgi:UDP-glucose:glycoprotein glucosyltransferase